MIARLRRRLTTVAKQRLGPLVARRSPVRTDLPPATWGLAAGPTGTLCSDAVDLVDLLQTHGSPLHVVRADRLDRNALDATTGGAEIFSSYKTNPVPAVVGRLHAHGIGAEVISPYELWLAMRLGVPGDRLIYNGPAKSPASLRDAIRHGVRLVNVNSATEAVLVARLAAEERLVVRMGVRISVPGSWGGQFGIGDAATAAAVIRAAVEDPWVSLEGVHVHRGGTMRREADMSTYLATLLSRVSELRRQTGWSPAIVDVGGSLACPTSAGIPPREFRLNRALGVDLLPPDPSDCLTIAAAGRLATSMVEQAAAADGAPHPRVILEPGRALTGDTQFLLTTVIDVKDDGPLTHVVLDAGINVAEPVRSEYHQLFSVTDPHGEASVPYRLTGPICTPADVLYNHWRLPPVAPGHVLAIMDTGAYFVPFSTTFSFPKPAIAWQEGPDVRIVRRRESFDDVVALDE